MNLSNSDNHSETSAFKKFKCTSNKYYPTFRKVCKNEFNLSSNRSDKNLPFLLYGCLQNVKRFLSIGTLSENYILQIEMGRDETTAF